MKNLLFFFISFCLSGLLFSCATSRTEEWVPVVSGAKRAPVDINDVLVIDEFPLGEYVHVGYFEGPEGKIVRVSLDDKELIDYFKQKAADMGGNKIIVREPRIMYRSGEGKSTRVDVIFEREEMGTHGAEDLFEDTLPIDEESLRIY